MLNDKLHLFFHSELDNPKHWQVALTEQLGELHFSTMDNCTQPETVDIALLWTTPPSGLADFSTLKAVLSLGAGINQLDLSSLSQKVPLARLVDKSLTQTMVEYARAAVFRYHRAFHRFEQHSRQKTWQFETPLLAQHHRIGVLGLGELGSAIALALAEDGFKVRGFSQSPKNLPSIRCYSGEQGLYQLAAEVDMLINVLPLTAETNGVLNRSLFNVFNKPVFLINMGRGAHLIEEDLLEALDSGQIEAATLDVTQIEPLPRTSPLWNHPNVLITPHVAGLSNPEQAAVNLAENIRLAMAGKPLIHQVDFTKGY